jgi:hypothetical protein
MGLQMLLVGVNLYCIIGQPKKSTKKSKNIHINMFYQGFQTILSTTKHPGFEIWNFLNQLWNERSLLRHHENFHQIYQNIIVLLFQHFGQMPKVSINIFMCMTNHKES